MRILMVDDRAEIIDSAIEFFGNIGVSIETALTNAVALDKFFSVFSKRDYDCIVADNIDGENISTVEFVQRVRREDKKVGIVIFSGRKPDIMNSFDGMGVYDIVDKENGFDGLLESITEAVEIKDCNNGSEDFCTLESDVIRRIGYGESHS